jgi:AraC family transcriptional regulator, positive regulator of tynA and feaB
MAAVTTEALPPRERFDYWRDAMSRQPVSFRLERAGAGQFQCAMEARSVDRLAMVVARSANGVAHRTKSEVADSPASFYCANVHLGGLAGLGIGNTMTTLAPGDIFFADTLRDFTFGGEGVFRCLSLLIPKEWIGSRLPRADMVHGSIARQDNVPARLLAGYLHNGFALAEGLTGDAASLFIAHTVDLLAAALGGAKCGEHDASAATREALFVRACRIIEVNCGDPCLAPEQIASKVGVSKRLLHRLFAARSETVMRRVIAERVGRAAKLLAAPESRQRSITEIAFACGFNDSAHFSRAFAERMHMTASEWRKQVFL